MNKQALKQIIREEIQNVLKESYSSKGKITAHDMVKLFKNVEDWGEDFKNQVYVKGGNLIVIDSFYYGQDRAIENLVRNWSPGGDMYEYFNKHYGLDFDIVHAFSEFKASGRHRKLTDNGIVGVELKIINNEANHLGEGFGEDMDLNKGEHGNPTEKSLGIVTSNLEELIDAIHRLPDIIGKLSVQTDLNLFNPSRIVLSTKDRNWKNQAEKLVRNTLSTPKGQTYDKFVLGGYYGDKDPTGGYYIQYSSPKIRQLDKEISSGKYGPLD